MERHETQKILTVLKVNYPNTFRKFTREESEAYLDLWAEAFKHDYSELVVAAVKAIIYSDVREFAPNIAQVKQMMLKLAQPEELTEQEAWSIAYKAVCNSIYDAEREFQKLPKAVQSTIGSPEILRDWAKTDIETVNSVIASNFMRSYKVRVKQLAESELLPHEVKSISQAYRKIQIDNAVDRAVLRLGNNKDE